RDDALRFREDRGDAGKAGRGGVVRLAVGPSPRLQGPVVRQRGRVRERVREGVQLPGAVPGGGVERRGPRLRGRVPAGAVVRSAEGARRDREDGRDDLLRPYQVRRDREEHGETDGALPGAARRLQSGVADQVGGDEADLAAQAAAVAMSYGAPAAR